MVIIGLLLVFNYLLTLVIIKDNSFSLKEILVLLIPFLTLMLFVSIGCYFIFEDILDKFLGR